MNYPDRGALDIDRYGIATSMNYLRHKYWYSRVVTHGRQLIFATALALAALALIAYHFGVLG